jgi:cytochrome c
MGLPEEERPMRTGWTVPFVIAIAGIGVADVPQGQAARGRDAYARHCASCHGARGEGKRHVAPPIVGPKALPLDPHPKSKYRNVPFRTAQDLATFVIAKMPPGLRRKPTCGEYWAIVAHLLAANGIAAPDPLGPHNASTVSLRR